MVSEAFIMFLIKNSIGLWEVHHPSRELAQVFIFRKCVLFYVLVPHH